MLKLAEARIDYLDTEASSDVISSRSNIVLNNNTYVGVINDMGSIHQHRGYEAS